MRFDNLPAWLRWQENLHFTEVDPGLERIGQVWQALGGNSTLPCKIVTVAGTNGKGSSVAMLASILKQAGYRVGTYTSPHLLRYNERICINGEPCDDALICAAFDKIDQARGNISLTYFEFATLAASLIFIDSQLDVVIFEVGMGGRLDAVNLFDADIALITPISLDHTQWLGDSREQIANEKAGVLRLNQSVVCTEALPAISLVKKALTLNADLSVAENDFSFVDSGNSWQWNNETSKLENLIKPALQGHYQLQNAAAVLQVVYLLNEQGFTVSKQHIEQGLASVHLIGRFQEVKTEVGLHIFDVTHNQQGALNLARVLKQQPSNGKTFAVLAMLADKDVQSVVEPLADVIDVWYLAGLNGSRGMSAEDLSENVVKLVPEQKIKCFEMVEDAYQQAALLLTENDRLLVFGSFHTVEAIMRLSPELFEQ